MPELHLRVFISSPGDVADERAAARQVLTYLPKEYVFRNRVLIEEVSWDDPGAPVPMDAHLTPQDAINQHRLKPSQCDIVGVILWSRMGTPLPPTIQKPDGTPYLSGTEWEFLDAVTSAEQTGRPRTLVYRRLEEPQVGLDGPDPGSKIQQYEAVKAFFADFRNPNGSLRRSYQTYRTTSEFQDLLERELRELISKRLDTLPKNEPLNEKVNQGALTQPTDTAKDIAWQGNPYRGLEPFREEHAPIFFGRGKETDELVKRFTNPTPRVVAVIGASGSGKSSLVSAGLIPRLKAGAVPGSAQWVTVRFTPAEGGDNPFLSVIQRLLPHLADNTESAPHLASTLQTNPTSIETLANQALKTKPSTAELLVFADQFEELFTSRVNEAYQSPFITLVDTIARSHRLRLVLTLRADYYGYCTNHESFAVLLRQGSFPLSAPNPLALAEMIERPAQLAGLELEPGLVNKILQDVAGESVPLALVEFTLERLYEAKRSARLTLDDYRSFNGVGGVIEIQGERAVRNALGQVDENALSHVFRALADVEETGGAVRKRVPLKAFGDVERVLIEQLVQSRLLETNPDEADEAWVQVAHEAVLRHWPRLTQWLESNRGFMLWRRRLKVIRESQNLLRDAALAEALGWWDKHGEDLDTDERDFIEKSLEEVERHQQEARKRRLWGLAVSAVALMIAVGAGTWWYQDYQRRRPILHKEDWVLIKPGTFQMGSPDTDDEALPPEKPLRKNVTISKHFKLSRHEVTFEEYDRFAYATNRRPPSDSGRGADFNDADRRQLPVINVSWHEARAYAEWLSKETGKRFRLPTEAEWEYAARAGTTERRHWGDDTSHNQACTYENVLDLKHEGELKTHFNITWDVHACEDDYAKLAPVGKFQPNKWGLHDMLGNVSEWMEDCWHDTYKDAPKDGRAWGQENGGNCKWRVVRNGSWLSDPRFVRSASRVRYVPGGRDDILGFRLAQDVE